ncbi:B3 domain-containing protein Os06g0112300-like [Aegilops tauschii subsp. strangulata]|uniref:B3 domain-containing protein Os06g0112300-like n=1 Tax=Aegilops tauschii subsp. strangulata TaxID=200361 RepID=UPI000989BC54|nr:B3 domain-containing protein Os06g0112300-like [Aegilops tauschii subsp. strangulata]
MDSAQWLMDLASSITWCFASAVSNEYFPNAGLQQRAEEDEEITPLSGDRPFFTAVMCKTHVQKPYVLIIPTHFQRRLPARRAAVVLRCRGSSWIMSYCGDTKLKRLDQGWADFAVQNRLQVGDACVFELVSGYAGDGGNREVVLEVQVLRGGGLPEPEDLATKGDTAEEAIAILD